VHFYNEEIARAKNKGKPAGKYADTKTSPGRKGDYQRSGWPEAAATQHVRNATSALGLNRSNVRRKPSARRTSPFKQMMRKQKISPQLAEMMRTRPEKGDRRRTVAQRKLTAKARARASTLVDRP